MERESLALRQSEILSHASLYGLEEEIQSYALQIQRILGSDGDTCSYLDALEMAYHELILSNM